MSSVAFSVSCRTFELRNAQFDADPKTLTVDADADVAFEWSGGHDVWLLDEDGYEGCAFSGGSYLGGSSGVVAAGPAAGETLYFSCSVGSHCSQGQKIAITGAAADDDADSTSWYFKKSATASRGRERLWVGHRRGIVVLRRSKNTCEKYVSKKSKNCKKKDEFKVKAEARRRRPAALVRRAYQLVGRLPGDLRRRVRG